MMVLEATSIADIYPSRSNYRLHLGLFGLMSLIDPNGVMIDLRGKKARAVLAILAMSPGPVLRQTLINMLWSNRQRDKAHASLRHSVYEIQQALRGLDPPVLEAKRHYIKLEHDMVRTDVKLIMNASLRNPESLALVKTTLLEDLAGLDPEFDIWIESKRQCVLERARTITEAVLDEVHEPKKRIIAARCLLMLDPTIDRGWNALISAHKSLGELEAAKDVNRRRKSVYTGQDSDVASANTTLPDLEYYLAPRSQALQDIEHRPDYRFDKKGRISLAIIQFDAFEQNSMALAKGLTQEITESLLKFRGLACFPIERANDKGGEMPTPIGSDIDFVINGSVQQSSSGVRVTVQLADARNHCEIVWSKRLDRSLSDVLATQLDVASEVVAQIEPELTLRKGLRTQDIHDDTLTSLEYTLRAIPAIHRLDRREFVEAGRMLAAAVAQDSANGAAHAWWAYWHLLLLGQGWASNSPDAEARTWALSKRAIALDPGDARALALAGHVQAFTHKRIDEAMILHERALSINPNLPIAWLFSGLAHTYAGFHDEAISRVQYAKKLSPRDPLSFFFEMALTLSFSLNNDDRKAVEHARSAAIINPCFSSTFKAYLSALGFVGSYEDRTHILEQLLNLEPNLTISDALRRSPLRRHEDRRKFAEGLRLSGLPE